MQRGRRGQYVVQCVIVWSLLVLVLAFVTSLHITSTSLHTQSIFTEEDSFFYILGEFIVEWNKEKLQLSVHHEESNEAVFSSPQKEAFIAVGVGPKIPVQTFSPGHYKVRTRVRCLTTIQSIEQVVYKADRITISGSLQRHSAGLSQFGGLLGLIYHYEESPYSSQVLYDFTLKLRSNQSLEYEISWQDAGLRAFHRRCHGKYNRIFLRFASHPEEMFFGLGMQYTSFMHNGRRLPVISQEQGIGRGLQPVTGILNRMFRGEGGSPFTTYSAIPHIMSTYNRSMVIYDNLISIFDFTAVPTPQLPPPCPSCRKERVSRINTIQQVPKTTSFDWLENNEENGNKRRCAGNDMKKKQQQQQVPDMEGLVRFLASYNISMEDPLIRNELSVQLQALNQDSSMDEIIEYEDALEEQDEDLLQCSVEEPGIEMETHRALVELNSMGILESLGFAFANDAGCEFGECEAIEGDLDECEGDIFAGWEEGQVAEMDALRPLNTPQVQIQICATASEKKVAGIFFQGTNILNTIQEYTTYSGRMKALPAWTYRNGSIIAMTGGTKNVLRQYYRLRNSSLPLAAVWLQDWPGLRMNLFGERLWWNWQLNRQHYPQWENLVGQMQKDDVKVLLYANPYLANVAIYPVQVKQARTKSQTANVTLVMSPYPQRKWISMLRLRKPKVSLAADPSYDSTLFQEALQKGYLVQAARGKMPYLSYSGTKDFKFGTIDFTNPLAREWMAQVLAKNMLGVGAHGFMSDFGELLPMDARLHNGESASFVHNQFPEYWSMVSRRAFEIANMEDEGLFFSRSAGSKSPLYAQLFWLGDQMTTWDEFDGLKSVVTAHMSAALSGLSLMHSDIGGYAMSDKHGVKFLRTKEMLLRWAELNAIADVVMRTHMGILPAKSWQVWSDETTISEYAFLVGLHSSFANYREKLMETMQAQGLPLVRHPMLHYPTNLQVKALRWQFMLGESVLACPVLDAAKSSVECFLPEAFEWLPIWLLIYSDSDIQKFTQFVAGLDFINGGVWVEAPAQILCPAIFFRRSRPESLINVLQYLQSNRERSQICKESWKKILI